MSKAHPTHWPLLLCMFMLPSATLAQNGAIKPDLSAMHGLIGAWTCTVTKNGDPSRIGKTFELTTSEDPSGYWIVTTTAHSSHHLTYDPRHRIWVSTALTDKGGYGLSTSRGWTGNTLVFTYLAESDSDQPGVLSITKLSENEYSMDEVWPAQAASSDDDCVKH